MQVRSDQNTLQNQLLKVLSEKKYSYSTEKLLKEVASDLVAIRKQLRKVVSLTKQVAGLTVYLLRLLVNKEGRVQDEETASREGLQRLETICLFQPGRPIDLGRVTLALARLCPQIHPTLT